jgi:hypothetical protein
VAEDRAVARRRLACSLFCLLIPLTVADAATAAPNRTAVLTDLRINEKIDGDVVVFAADLVLGPEARIGGDAVAIGGDVLVASGAEVGRHAVAVFGGVEVPDTAQVGGRVLQFASLASLLPPADAQRHSLELSLGMHLLTAGGWLVVTTGLAFLFPTRTRHAAWAVAALGIKVPAIGIMAGLTVVASLFAALGLGPGIGMPLVAALMVVFFAAKVVGLSVLGCIIGGTTRGRWLRHPLPISLEVFIGVLVLLALRFLPVAGETLWNLISLVALGAAVAVLGVTPYGTTVEQKRSQA